MTPRLACAAWALSITCSFFAPGESVTPSRDLAASVTSAGDTGEVLPLRSDEDDKPIEIDFTTLMDFKYERGGEIPKKIREYDGKEVRITGYMDTYTQENSRQFYLMSAECGCDGEVELNHFIDVRLTDQIVGYDPSRLDVVGTFKIEEYEEDGFLVSLFQIEGRIE